MKINTTKTEVLHLWDCERPVGHRVKQPPGK